LVHGQFSWGGSVRRGRLGERRTITKVAPAPTSVA